MKGGGRRFGKQGVYIFFPKLDANAVPTGRKALGSGSKFIIRFCYSYICVFVNRFLVSVVFSGP